MPDLISHTSQMRKSFMASHLLSEKIDESTVRDARNVKVDSDYREGAKGRIDSAFPDDDENEEQQEDEEEGEEEEEEEEGEEVDSHSSTAADSPVNVEGSNAERHDVHSALNSLDIRNKEDQRPTAISFHDVDKNNKTEDTKESLGRANSAKSMSLVQRRLLMFEAHDKVVDHADKKSRDKSAFREIKASPTALDATNNSQGDSWDRAPDVLRTNEEEQRPEKRLQVGSMINSEESFASVDVQWKEEGAEKEDSAITSPERHEDSFSRDIVRIKSEERLDNNKQIEDNRIVKGIEKQRESFERIESDRVEDNKDKTTKRKSSETAAESKLPTSADVVDPSVVVDDYPEDLNPFKSDEEDNNVMEIKRQTTRSSLSRSDKKVSTNPFDSEDDEEEEVAPPKPAARSSKPESRGGATTAVPTKRLVAAPQINFRSFWSDEEEERDGDMEERDKTSQGNNAPVPKPRTIRYDSVISLF